jgi:hypothetical protein
VTDLVVTRVSYKLISMKEHQQVTRCQIQRQAYQWNYPRPSQWFTVRYRLTFLQQEADVDRFDVDRYVVNLTLNMFW